MRLRDPVLVALLLEARGIGLLGPGPVERHIDHAAAFASVIAAEAPGVGVDLGSGAGLPGLVLGQVLPAWRWLLVEAGHRRFEHLRLAVARLGLEDTVEVVEERAEATGRRPSTRFGFDAVVARGFGRPAVLAECAAPLLVPGGLVVVSEPPDGADDRWPAAGLAGLGLEVRERRVHPALVVLRRSGPVDDRYPRRVGVPAKRPLW